METKQFSYTRKDGSVTYDDGRATRLGFGVHVEMWGGENAYWFTTTSGQNGAFTAVLTSSIVDSVDVPVRKWQYNSREFAYDHEVAKIDEICQEAAEVIGGGCVDDDSVETLRKILFEDQQL